MIDAEARSARWLQAWDAQGTHRTGTEGEITGAEWLAAEARALGAEVAIEEFSFDRLDPVDCHLDIAGERVEGVPVFDAPVTGADGIAGSLGGDIAVVKLPPRAVYSGEFERLRRAGGHRALVVVCQGDAPGMGLINAEHFRAPYGAPAIHVPSEACDIVLAAARQGVMARLVAHGRRTPAQAINIIVALEGRD
ncbi:MAG: hypothetical protein J2P48_07870, partial [Alphaproteobacteria bacterium]|nr:hypothetical protein [Alphaproteobacteria bacterium]